MGYAYDVSPSDDAVHQYVTKEALDVWKLIPPEIKNYAENSISTPINDGGYDNNDDVIDGSGEEDTTGVRPYREHFWDPDDPNTMTLGNNDYNDGLWFFDSSYRRAIKLWYKKCNLLENDVILDDNCDDVINNYLRGNVDEAYYYLGRVAHLLQDATVPAHVHKDYHGPSDPDAFEDYASTVFTNYGGLPIAGEQYNYEDLPNADSLDWSEIDSKDKQFIELFRLFWYTAQKTQYYASDNYSGNDEYTKLDDTTLDLPNLWQDDGVNIISNKNDIDDNLDDISDAMIPHAMKATAGLYRLFWDTVHSYSWPTYHHDNRRTGFTLLKGDMEKGKTQRKAINLVLGSRDTAAALARPSIANLDNDKYQDVVVGYLVDDEDDGWISAVGKNWWGNTKEKWKKNIGYKVLANPSIGNLDDDNELEVIVGLYNGTLILIDPDGSKDPPMRSYTVDKKYSAIGGSDVRGRLGFTAIANLDNEGRNEIIFADNSYNYDWNGTLYVLGYEGNNLVEKDLINLTEGIGGADGGAHGAVAIANIDSDDNLEIVVPGFYGIKVYEEVEGDVL